MHCLIQALMDFHLNNKNNPLINNNTKLLRWSIFLNIHYTNWSNFWHAFASRGFVRDSWAFLFNSAWQRCHETPHRVHCAHRTASRREQRVTGRFAPSLGHPLNVLIGFLLVQLKPTRQGCKRDVWCRDRDETETSEWRDRDIGVMFSRRDRDISATSPRRERDETFKTTSRDVRSQTFKPWL